MKIILFLLFTFLIDNFVAKNDISNAGDNDIVTYSPDSITHLTKSTVFTTTSKISTTSSPKTSTTSSPKTSTKSSPQTSTTSSPQTSTTSSPQTSTTSSPQTSTKSSPQTTTISPPMTSTASSTTQNPTTVLPPLPYPTIAPSDIPNAGNWNISKGSGNKTTVCLMLHMASTIDIKYEVKPGKQFKTVMIPIPTNATSRGECVFSKVNQSSSQSFNLSFPINSYTWSILINFTSSLNSSKDLSHYVIDSMKLKINMKSFHDALISDEEVLTKSSLKMLQASKGKSIVCNSEQVVDFNNMTSIHLYHMQVEPFMNSSKAEFGQSVVCLADDLTNNVVPIAVGSALCALIIIVLVAYIIAKKRKRAGYQPV